MDTAAITQLQAQITAAILTATNTTATATAATAEANQVCANATTNRATAAAALVTAAQDKFDASIARTIIETRLGLATNIITSLQTQLVAAITTGPMSHFPGPPAPFTLTPG